MSDKKRLPAVLRDLKIKSVSVVNQGANQHAHIKLTKQADEPDTEADTELIQSQSDNDAAFFARIGRAVAKFFRVESEDETIDKDKAHTFDDINNSKRLCDKIYNISEALNASLNSIMFDADLSDEDKAGMIALTADQAAQAIKNDIAGIYSAALLTKDAGDGTEASPQPSQETKSDAQPKPDNSQTGDMKKGEIDMRFNTDAMTDEEKLQLEELQKRYGMPDEQAQAEQPAANDDAQADTDVYKGIHPAVKAEIEALRKFKEDAENNAIFEVAKRYTIIGKKPEELAPLLKSMKDAGGTAYADMIAVLDSAVDAVEKSGIFNEIGKRGNGGSTGDDSWGRIEVAAQEIIKSNSGMTYAQAIDKACMEHPDLLQAYENSRK